MGTRKGTSSRSFIFRAMIALFFAIVLFVTPLLSVFTSIFTDNGDGDSNGSRKGSIPGTEVLAAAGWDEADFLVSGDTITGLSAEGISELSVDPDMKIPASFTTKVSPDTPVTKIAANAFTNYADSSTPINSVDIPSGFTDIGASAFQNSGLTAITLPATLITIDNQAFMGNTIATFDFTTLTALTTLGDGAFRENLLTSLTLPSNITKVGRYAFMNNKLTSVTLPNVTEIGEKAFANNKLAAVTLPGMTIDTTASTGIIHATAFDQNGKVVKVTVTDNDPAINSHFSGGSGFIINPVTITVTPLDYNDGASPHDPVGSPFVIGNDLTSDDLFERGTTTTVNAPVYTGYTAVDENTGAPASAQTLNNIGTNPADPDHESVTFYYKAANEKPTITANDRYITQSSAHTQAEILSWASAVAADGTTIPTSTNSAAVPGLVIESITIGSTYYGNEITTSMSETAGTVINITYKATDSLGNEARKTIKVTADSDPMQAYIPKADGTLSAWQYRDFTYVNETVTVSVLKYPSTTASPSYYTETVTGVTVTGFSAYGNAKYEGTTYSGVNYASVKAAAQANLVLPGINPSTGQAVVAISSTAAGGGTKFNTKKTNAPGAIDLSNMSALEIIGNDAFSSGDSTTTGSTPAYGDINFGNSGARLTKLRAIGDSAFRWNKVVNLDLSGLTALVIIGDYAFSDSSGNKVADAGGHALQSIDFSNLPALLAIGDWYDAGGRTFMNSQLRSIDLSGAPNLEQIGVAIFCSAAPNNVTITIPAFPLDLSMLDKLKIIGQHAFRDYPISELNISGMESLERIDGQNFGHLGSATLEIKDDPKLSVISPLVFNVSILTRTPFATSSVQTLIIDNCDSLVELHIALGGSSWATGDHGFEDLPLTSLVITNNDSLTTLSAPANTIKTSTATTPYFQDMNLTSITIDNNDSLTTIPYRAFYNSQSTTLVIANNDALVTIDQEAFTKNHAATLDLSTNPMLTTIGKNAFSQNNLASLPTGDGGSYLTSLNLNGLTHLDTIGNEAFANSKLTGTLDFTSNTALKNIGTRAFRSSAITDVAFPPSIELIGIMAFAYYSGDSLVLADLPNLKILSAGAFGQYNTEGSPAPLQTLELRNLPSLVNLNRADASYNGTPVEAGDYLAAATKETAYCATPGPDGIFGTGDDVTQGTAIVGGNFGNSLPNLTTLTIDNVGLYGLPPKAFYASPLTSLTIRNMPNLTNIGLYGDKTIPNEVTYNGMSYGTTDISGADQGAVA
ncbi:MAG: leucine-rich repeat domain-containing protein, partial [Lachnospiraceae bacterium]|nr:leucine-rich repeat domain-containing protein [Lachnospiraceae bacterium]